MTVILEIQGNFSRQRIDNVQGITDNKGTGTMITLRVCPPKENVGYDYPVTRSSLVQMEVIP